MNIGIIDADLLDNGTRHPNLALMKISAYYKERDNQVSLILTYDQDFSKYDRLFMSKVFSFTNVPEEVLNLPNIEIGGTGFYYEKAPNLPDEIEHHKPDYHLYDEYIGFQLAKGQSRTKYADYLDYSIGFTTRGCFRKCDFCVNKKYDHAFLHSPVDEFLDEDRPYIYLWDDNILAYPEWEKILDDLERTGKPYQFRQGIDLRLMTDKKAYRFSNAHYQGDFIFAFDHIEDRDVISKNVQLWKRYSSKVCKMYVLCGFDSQDERDISNTFERIKILMTYGSLPYIMRYEAYQKSPYRALYVELARWCNQPQFFKKKSFKQFCIANQEYKKDKSSNCSAYQSMLDFEHQFPEVAKQYFDIRFDELNIYKKQYGYGRRFANKPHCETCKNRGLCWETLLNDEDKRDSLLTLYFTKQIDLLCLDYENSECNLDSEIAAEKLCNILLATPIKKIVALLRDCPDREEVTAENIPQYSDLSQALYYVPHVLFASGNPLTFDELGEQIFMGKDNDIAKRKYGENHSKLCALLDLSRISKDSATATIEITALGKVFLSLTNEDRDALLIRLCYRIPIIQNAVLSVDQNKSINDDLSILSQSTQRRRMVNVMTLLEFALSEEE